MIAPAAVSVAMVGRGRSRKTMGAKAQYGTMTSANSTIPVLTRQPEGMAGATAVSAVRIFPPILRYMATSCRISARRPTAAEFAVNRTSMLL